MHQFQQLLSSLGKYLGEIDLQADTDGYIAMQFDEHNLHMQWDADNDQVILFTTWAFNDPIQVVNLYPILLGANLFWQATRGATFSVDPTSKTLYLADHQPLSVLNDQRFHAWIEHFLTVTEYWHQRLSSMVATDQFTH